MKLSREYTLRCRLGARASALLWHTASRFSSSIAVIYRGVRADAKDSMRLLMIGPIANGDATPPLAEGSSDQERRRWVDSMEPQSGHAITIEADGPDAEEAMKRLTLLFDRNFDFPAEPPKPYPVHAARENPGN